MKTETARIAELERALFEIHEAARVTPSFLSEFIGAMKAGGMEQEPTVEVDTDDVAHVIGTIDYVTVLPLQVLGSQRIQELQEAAEEMDCRNYAN